MLKQHDRLTNKVDKEELEKLMKDNKVLNESGFGVLFDFKYTLNNGGNDNYRPKMGTLVAFKKMDEKSHEVEVEFLGSGEKGKVPVQGFIPIDKGQILKTGGQNALQRYQQRVRRLKFQAKKIAKYRDGFMAPIDKVADRGDAPLVQFGSGSEDN